jgi:hypothetical protein
MAYWAQFMGFGTDLEAYAQDQLAHLECSMIVAAVAAYEDCDEE